MQIVINIDDEDYKKVLDANNRDVGWNIAHACYEAVLDGTPLPKGHWIKDGHIIKCSNCGKTHDVFDTERWIEEHLYCYSCGARMGRVKDADSN